MEIPALINEAIAGFNDVPQIITGLLVFPPLLYLMKRLSGTSKGLADQFLGRYIWNNARCTV